MIGEKTDTVRVVIPQGEWRIDEPPETIHLQAIGGGMCG